MKKFYLCYGYRTFVYLGYAKDELLKGTVIFPAHLYDTFEEADKACSKICDGGTEMVVGIELVNENDFYYIVAIDNPDFKPAYYERYIVYVEKKRLKEFFGKDFDKLFEDQQDAE